MRAFPGGAVIAANCTTPAAPAVAQAFVGTRCSCDPAAEHADTPPPQR